MELETIYTSVYPTRYAALDNPGKLAIFKPELMPDGELGYRSCRDDSPLLPIETLSLADPNCPLSVGVVVALHHPQGGYLEIYGRVLLDGTVVGARCQVDYLGRSFSINATGPVFSGWGKEVVAAKPLDYFLPQALEWLEEQRRLWADTLAGAWTWTPPRGEPCLLKGDELRWRIRDSDDNFRFKLKKGVAFYHGECPFIHHYAPYTGE